MRQAECVIRLSATMPELPADWTDNAAVAEVNRATEEMLRSEFKHEEINLESVSVEWRLS